MWNHVAYTFTCNLYSGVHEWNYCIVYCILISDMANQLELVKKSILSGMNVVSFFFRYTMFLLYIILTKHLPSGTAWNCLHMGRHATCRRLSLTIIIIIINILKIPTRCYLTIIQKSLHQLEQKIRSSETVVLQSMQNVIVKTHQNCIKKFFNAMHHITSNFLFIQLNIHF